MADPLLTSLCAICHVLPPKYRCPRCALQTCSLPCVRRHKLWSECDGARDQTAYVPPNRLRTAAGVDHDYNFLHRVELAMQQAESELVEERGILVREELRQARIRSGNRSLPGRAGRGRGGRGWPGTATRAPAGPAPRRKLERHLYNKLRALNIEVLLVERGMQRHRENGTTLNRSKARVNWQVEWVVVDPDGGRTRMLAKAMDHLTLREALAQCRARHAIEAARAKAKNNNSKTAGDDKPGGGGKKRRRDSDDDDDDDATPRAGVWQDHRDGAWTRAPPLPAQNPRSTAWSVRAPRGGGAEGPGDSHRFFLARPREPTVVTPLGEGEATLREVLEGARVLEFPTIYAVADKADRGDGEDGDRLPAGLSRGPKDMAAPKSEKRKRGGKEEREGEGWRRKRHRGEVEGEAVEGEAVEGEAVEGEAAEGGRKVDDRFGSDEGEENAGEEGEDIAEEEGEDIAEEEGEEIAEEEGEEIAEEEGEENAEEGEEIAEEEGDVVVEVDDQNTSSSESDSDMDLDEPLSARLEDGSELE